MLPENIHELHLIDGFDIPKTPSESYVIEVDFGPSENPPKPGLIDVQGGEYIDALRSSVSAHSFSQRRMLRQVQIPPGESGIGIVVGNSYYFHKIPGYDVVEIVAVSSELSQQPEPLIDYGSISMAGAKVTFKLAGRDEEHPGWGGVPGTRYAIVFKIVTSWSNVYWRVGFVTVNEEI